MRPAMLAAAFLFIASTGSAQFRRQRSRSGSSADLAAVELSPLQGLGKVSLGRCPAARCLYVYVTPWCGFCRKATPLIKSLQSELKFKGLPMRVIVGDDREDKIRSYAAELGRDTLLDPEKKIRANGVPYLFMTDKQGKVIRSRQGMPDDLDEAVAWATER